MPHAQSRFRASSGGGSPVYTILQPARWTGVDRRGTVEADS
jgi:hypothetical protein